MKPGDLKLQSNRLLGWLVALADDEGRVITMGDPPTVMNTLLFFTGVRVRQHIRSGMRELARCGIVEYDLGFHAVKVVWPRVGAVGILCMSCGKRTADAGKWCPICKQRMREDREWQSEALKLFDAGTPTLVIASRLNRPHFVAIGDDARTAAGGAVVPFLIRQGRELPADVLAGFRAATSGHLEDSA